jgi:hypothetical protein
MVLSYLTVGFLLFYIAITMRDYIVRPPELISQGDIDILQVAREIPFHVPTFGLRVGYTNSSGTGDAVNGVAALANVNPYVRFQIRHVVMKDQVRIRETELDVQDCIVGSIPSQCPIINDTFRLQGIYFKQDYEFIEILVNKCTGEAVCAPLSVINDKISSGEFRIRAQVSMEAELFDVDLFHETGSGFAISNRSFEYFGLPNVEVQSDIYMQARRISKEQRYAGSPPLPETEINVLSLRGRETNYLPRTTNETNLMTFVIRLADNVKLEEVSYWCPSILDLFGLWGAMASFAATLSLGFIAYQYNKWNFNRHFRNATLRKRREAQQQTLATMRWLRNTQQFHSTTVNREHMYQNLQAQYDTLMIEPDIRLFETHHFDDDGRMAMTAAELKFPSTPFGELRRMAIQEHSKKKRAAHFLSVWYGRHLVRKGFVKDERRRRELFAPAYEELSPGARNAHGFELCGRRFRLQSLRRRKRKLLPQNCLSSMNNSNTDDVSRTCDDLERGTQTSGIATGVRMKDNTSSDESNSQTSISLPSGDFKDDDDENDAFRAEQQRALNVIADLDLGTPTKKL